MVSTDAAAGDNPLARQVQQVATTPQCIVWTALAFMTFYRRGRAGLRLSDIDFGECVCEAGQGTEMTVRGVCILLR